MVFGPDSWGKSSWAWQKVPHLIMQSPQLPSDDLLSGKGGIFPIAQTYMDQLKEVYIILTLLIYLNPVRHMRYVGVLISNHIGSLTQNYCFMGIAGSSMSLQNHRADNP
jgi:hypothetical protein